MKSCPNDSDLARMPSIILALKEISLSIPERPQLCLLPSSLSLPEAVSEFRSRNADILDKHFFSQTPQTYPESDVVGRGLCEGRGAVVPGDPGRRPRPPRPAGQPDHRPVLDRPAQPDDLCRLWPHCNRNILICESLKANLLFSSSLHQT